ncbi:hypothetical protein BDB01DRAFT_693451, partial [Pilobolus umbonatus]
PIGYLTFPHLITYEEGLRLQSYLVNRRHHINQQLKEGEDCSIRDIICFLQHPPTYTAGRRIRGKSNEDEKKRLMGLGADYYETMRGGEVTYHGPGQLIAYPIIDIRDYNVCLNVRCYVSLLEKIIIDCCSKYDIKANTTEHTGVWVGNDSKIAALGVHLQRYVTSHGMALNCNTDLTWFNHIVACGLPDKHVTSISKEKNRTITTDDVLPHLIQSFEQYLSKSLVPI